MGAAIGSIHRCKHSVASEFPRLREESSLLKVMLRRFVCA